MIERRKTREVKVGDVSVGGMTPVSIQSMTKTDTKDIDDTVAQAKRLKKEGCEIIRVAVPNYSSARAIREIKEGVKVPLVADIHFNYKLAIVAMENGADAIRLNPGNISRVDQIQEVVEKAKEYSISIRVGVNSGSLPAPNPQRSTAQRMVQGAQDYIKILERLGFYDIIVSLKASDVLTTIEAYRLMAKSCDYPFHLGVTATGLPHSGAVKSAVGVGSLLAEGIGDTIRVSLTGDPLEEVRVAKEILSSLGLRSFGPEIISCPTCGRCEIDLVKIVKEVEKKLSQPTVHSPQATGKMKDYRQPLKVAIMGCVVNGPGEAKDADIGIAGGKDLGVIFKKGKRVRKVKEKYLVDELLREIKTIESNQ